MVEEAIEKQVVVGEEEAVVIKVTVVVLEVERLFCNSIIV